MDQLKSNHAAQNSLSINSYNDVTSRDALFVFHFASYIQL